MSHGYFITGTDTGIGKTRVAVSLLRHLAARGERVVGMKPVASGCELRPEGWRNADAEALRAAANVVAEYHDINPYALPLATAPHWAARQANVEIDLRRILEHYDRLCALADCVVVEGVGGWRVPLGGGRELADLAVELNLPTILVVGVRLGALNHASLSLQAMRASGVSIAGWVANRLDPDPLLDFYIDELRGLLDVPLLAEFPFDPRPTALDHVPHWQLERVR